MFKEKYYLLIKNAKKQNRSKLNNYYELHHIIPKSLGGTNDKSNLVLLTPEEHYTAHYYLWKFTDTPQMAQAFWFMCIHNGSKISKEEFSELRKQAALISAKNHEKPVYCLELDKYFNSCQEACLEITGSINHSSYIGTVCNKKIKACFEWKNGLRYHWCWANEAEEYKKHKDELILEEINRKKLTNAKISLSKKGNIAPNCISVLCVELNKSFSSLKEAANFCNGVPYCLKNNAIKGTRYHSYHWRINGYNPELSERTSHMKGKHLPEETKKKLKQSKSIKVKCLENNIAFNSLRDAAIWLGLSKTAGWQIKESALKNEIFRNYHWQLI